MVGKIIKQIAITILCLASCLSCGSHANHPFLIDNEYEYNRNGRVDNPHPLLINDKNKVVVTYLDDRVIDFVLGDIPEGKIDRIMQDNPDWSFIFIINSRLQDSLTIVHKLNQYRCHFSVILDVNQEFKKENSLGNIMAITYVYEKNNIINLGVIGSSRSFFDEEFEHYKISH